MEAIDGNYGTGETANQFKTAIEAKHEIPIVAVKNDINTQFDSYLQATVDVGDLSLGDKAFRGSIYAHFMAERNEAGTRFSDYSVRKQDLQVDKKLGFKRFSLYHHKGLEAENRAMKFYTGNNNLYSIRLNNVLHDSDILRNSITGYDFIYGGGIKYIVKTTPTFLGRSTILSIDKVK